MKTLIAEDDLISRFLLKDFLEEFGPCDTVVDGNEAIAAFRLALEKSDPYDLVCMDIMMPRIDGQKAVAEIRAMEKERSVKAADAVKIIMVTALSDPKNVMDAYHKGGATSYIVKPLDREKLLEELRILGLVRRESKEGNISQER